MPASFIDHQDNTYTIDADYVQAQVAGFHLLVVEGRGAFFDTGTTLSLPRAKALLTEIGLNQEDIEYVIPTHVHLDHAGGAGAMMQAFPKAKMIIHPNGKRHMVDPSKLWSGTIGVYGEQTAKELFGEIIPVTEDRIIVAQDEFEIDFQGRKLLFIDTRGHARHHFCVVDSDAGSLFAGDMLGISYRIFDCNNGPFIFPSSSPTQFEPEPFHESINRIESYKLKHAYLAHFGRIELSDEIYSGLHEKVDHYVEIAMSSKDEDNREDFLIDKISKYLFAEAKAHGVTLSDETIRMHLAMDAKLNAQGLNIWLNRLNC